MLRLIVSIVAVFGFLVWDMARNHGAYTRSIDASVQHTLRQLDLR